MMQVLVVLSDAWLGGGFASKTKCIRNPKDVKGEVMRAAGKAFNQMLRRCRCWYSKYAILRNLYWSSNWSTNWCKH